MNSVVSDAVAVNCEPIQKRAAMGAQQQLFFFLTIVFLPEGAAQLKS